MRIINIKDHKISVYDDIMDMPVVRYNKYQKYMVLATGVGNDIPAVLAKIVSMQQMVGDEKKVKKLNSEFVALRNAFGFINDGIDPHSLAFACLVADIDGVQYNNATEDEIERVAACIASMATKKELTEAIYGVKKKSRMHLKLISRNRMASKQTSNPTH